MARRRSRSTARKRRRSPAGSRRRHEVRGVADVPHGLLARPVLWVRRGLAGVVALGLFAMMVLTVVDVTGRYLFSRPVPGSFEVIRSEIPSSG